MKVSFVATVFNEEKTIGDFLKSIFWQSRIPDEIIIVDGTSSDKTVAKIKNAILKIKNYNVKFKILIKKGNRAVGRNEAIKQASNEIIVCSDAGCILDKNWVKNIIVPFNDLRVDVVAGYYKGRPKTIFQKCLIPYVLVMEDKLNSLEFLPASRSMAFRKSIWEKVKGFDEAYSHNEDYVFAHKLKEIGAHIFFEKKAIVSWIPRNTFRSAFKMFFRFAFGDSESGIFRDKAILVFVRYFFSLYLLWLASVEKSLVLWVGIVLGLFIYIFWSIKKNYKYINNKKAFVVLPLLQVVSDLAVLTGTSFGIIKSILKINYKRVLKNNLVLIILLIIYVLTMLSVIASGIPNQTHPFPYHMDEWHQLSAVRNVFKFGSPNLAGSANGTMFHFFVSGILLIPFYITKVINPFVIKSSVDSLLDQERLFIVLRLTTLFFGILTLSILSKIAKLLKLNSSLIVILFLFTPVWLVLSNFFKYDIALTFWITLSFYYFLKYAFFPKFRNFLFACFFSGIAFSVKVSALPLLPIILISYFLFAPEFNENYRYLFIGILIFLFNSVFLGLPDIIFAGKSMYLYLYENIIGSSKIIGNYNLGGSLLNLTLLHMLPAIFGHISYALNIFAFFYVSVLTFVDLRNKKYHDFKIKLFIMISFIIFSLSFIPLGITISANRLVILLPLAVLIVGTAFKNLINLLKNRPVLKNVFIILLVIISSIQVFESYLWINLKIAPSPQQLSSRWIMKNVQKNSNIGLENIPIYQFEPDFILKEFYNKQYNSNTRTKYNYFIINKDTKNLPKYIVISNINYEKKYLKTSIKNELVNRISKEGYREIAYFPLTLPAYRYFDGYFYYPYVGLFAYPDGISIFEKKK